MHPEGNAYFEKKEVYNLGCKSINVRFLTEDFVNDPNTSGIISDVIIELKTLIGKLGEEEQNQIPEDIDAYVGGGGQSGEFTKAMYYLVGCKDRRVFWAEQVDLNGKYFYCGIPVQSPLHLGEWQILALLTLN